MPRGLLPIACGGGLLFFVAAWLQQAGIRTATVTNTGFLTALYVVITPFIAWGWNGRRPNAAVWPAIALSAFGTWLLGGGGLSCALAGRHAGGAVGDILGRARRHHRTRLALWPSHRTSRRSSSRS